MRGDPTLYLGLYDFEDTLCVLVRIPVLGGNRRMAMKTEDPEVSHNGKFMTIVSRWEVCKPGGGWKSFSVHSIVELPPGPNVPTVKEVPTMDGDLMLAVEGVEVHDSSQLVW